MDSPTSNNHLDPFDRIASRYDSYVPWSSRLAREIPFLDRELRRANAYRILDCACGPGRHAVALARKGFAVTALDASREMLEKARAHSREEGVEVDLIEGRFESIPDALHGRFDGVICLGNSLSAAESFDTIPLVVRQLARALRPAGIVITQTVDFSVVAPDPVTPTPLRHVREQGRDLLFVKSFVRVGEQVFIHWVSMEQEESGWRSDVTFRPVTAVDPQSLMRVIHQEGFQDLLAYGDYAGNAFQAGSSRDLILVARRS